MNEELCPAKFCRFRAWSTASQANVCGLDKTCCGITDNRVCCVAEPKADIVVQAKWCKYRTMEDCVDDEVFFHCKKTDMPCTFSSEEDDDYCYDAEDRRGSSNNRGGPSAGL